MRVLSPVGTFPLKFTGLRVDNRMPVLDAAMGAWRSEVRVDRHDVPLIAAVVGVLIGVFWLGRSGARKGS